MKEPTPTLEEFVYSFVPTRMFQPSLENLLYWDIKLAITLSPMAVRTAWLMRGGMTFWQATYVAADTYAMYRYFTIPGKIRVAYSLLTNPVFGVFVTGVTAQMYTLSSPPPPEYRGSGQSGWWRSVAQALTGGIGAGTGIPL